MRRHGLTLLFIFFSFRAGAQSRSLVIQVKSVDDGSSGDARAGVSGSAIYGGTQTRIGGSAVNGFTYSGGGGRIQTNSVQTRSQHIRSSIQQVRVKDGGQALVQAAQTAFYASPHLKGDQVTIEITQKTFDKQGLERGGTHAEVSGPLGQWIALSGLRQTGSQISEGVGSRGLHEAQSNSRLYLRVNESAP